MGKIDVDAIPETSGSGYPEEFSRQIRAEGRIRKALGDAGGLTQYGINLTRLKPSSQSALRHWHESEDEFVYVLDGEVVMITDEGETVLGAGDCAAFPAGEANGHHLVNRSDADASYLEMGTRAPTERAHYPDDDLAAFNDGNGIRFVPKSSL